MSPLFVICALLVSEVSSAIIFEPPPSNSTVLEGGTAAFTCVPSGSAFINWFIDPVDLVIVVVLSGNSTILPGAAQVILSADRTQVTITGVQRSLDGASVLCRASSLAGEVVAPLAYIVVQRPPNFTLPELSRDVLEGQALSLTLASVDFGNSEGAVSVLFEGRVLSEGSRFTVSRSGSTWSLEFLALNRSDAGVYRVLLSNTIGSSEMNFTVNVVFPPEFTFPTVRSVQLSSGSLFTFDCTASAANPSSVDYSFHVNGSSQPFSVSGANLTISSVVRANTGNYSCTANNTVGSTTLYYNLLVVAPPQYSLRAGQFTTPLEGSTSFTYQFNLDNGGVEPSSFTWRGPGTSGVLMNGNKYTLTADSITVKNVGRDDSAMYTVSATNMAGSHSISITLDVQYPPEFTFPTVRSVQLNNGSQFSFDCRASAANPSSVDYSFHVNGSSQPFSESGPALTISSVVRANTGNYSCTANNTAGSSVTVYYNLLVVAPPTSPLNLMVPGEMAFSAMVTWTPPTDDGGISHPSWTPPSPSSSLIIQYTVTYSNSSGSWSIDNLNTPQVTLSNLQHSTDYTVTVAASNGHGQSTTVQGTFRTLDSKPILQAVVFSPLSLNNFTANVTFLTVGGQNVTSFSITINDSSPTVVDSTPVPDGKGVMVSLLIEGRSFTKGTYYTVEITATNSVGPSEPITGLLFVPNPPMITANFTEVSAGSIPSTKCCAGVQLMLAEQPDVSNLKVLLTPQGGNQFTVSPADLSLAEGSVLYIGGVQAGTDYTAVVTVSNIFGSSDDQLQLKPLLGVPSNPNPPTVSVDGGQVTVELSTAYPGTVQTRSGSMFSFKVEIQFIEDSQRSSRQSKTEMQAATPASLFNTSAILTTNLDPGSYSVSVTAVNEHGRSSAVMSESTFTVEVPPPPTGDDDTITIIIAIVVVVVLVLIVLIIAIICIICCMRVKKNKGTVKLGGKKSQTEPVYDIIETDLNAGTSVEMQGNPAYGTAESVTTTDKPIPGHVAPEYETVDSTAVGDSNVVLLENMAYGVIGDVRLPPTTTTTPSAAPPTQSTPGGLESEYEVMDMKKEVRKKATDVEGHYSNFSML